MSSEDRIHTFIEHSRHQLQEHFASFEKTLLSEIQTFSAIERSSRAAILEESNAEDVPKQDTIESSTRILGQFKDTIRSIHSPSAAKVQDNVSNSIHARDLYETNENIKKLSELEKAFEDEKQLNKNLEEMLERLRENVRVMGQEHQDLQNKIRQYEEEQKTPVLARQEVAALKSTVDENLQERIQRYELSRQRTTQLLRHWLQMDRKRRKLLKENKLKDDESHQQIKRLTDELDAALEHVAELRDELHLMGQSRTQTNTENSQGETNKSGQPQSR